MSDGSYDEIVDFSDCGAVFYTQASADYHKANCTECLNGTNYQYSEPDYGLDFSDDED